MRPAIVLAFILLSAMNAHAKSDFKLEGRLGLGAETLASGEVKDLFQLRLNLKTKRKEGVRADIEVKANENSRELSVRDAFADYRTEDENTRVRGGRGKKILGWEYEYPYSDLMSIDHSLVYRFLEDRSIVGRDFFTEYLRKISENWKLAFSAHYDESKDSALVLSAVHTPGSLWRFGLWASLQGNLNPFRKTNHLEFTLSTRYEADRHRAELEAFAGGDPYRTEIERFYGNGRRVRFAGFKGEYGLRLDSWNPYLIASLLFKDLDHTGDKSTEGIFGLRYFVTEPFQLAGEWRRVNNTSDFDSSTEPYHSDTFAFIARYYF